MLSRLHLGSLIGLVLTLSPVGAQDSFDKLYDIGDMACRYALEGHFDNVDGTVIASNIQQSEVKRVDYCNCVAMEFANGGESDLALLNSNSSDSVDYLGARVERSMERCLPSIQGADDGDLADWDKIDSDLAEALLDEELAYDEDDFNLCQLTLDDFFMTPGYKAVDVLERLESKGQSRSQLCTCAARYFVAGGQSLQDRIKDAENPTVTYANIMGDAFKVCLHSIQ